MTARLRLIRDPAQLAIEILTFNFLPLPFCSLLQTSVGTAGYFDNWWWSGLLAEIPYQGIFTIGSDFRT
jgi:hypothetical protein